MKVFVSGAAGFLGSHLADAVIEDGHEVAGCDNMIGADLNNLPEGIQFEEADCCDVDAMKRMTRGTDLIYHCAAVATEGLSVFSPALIAKHVYENTAGLLVGAASNKVKRFVFCSSTARYGIGHPPYTEDQIPNPVDPYGIAKYAAELLVRNVCETHGLEYVIAVPHNIIGPKQKYDDAYRNVASIMINRMLQGKQPIIYGDGEQTRDFVYVDDVVEACHCRRCGRDIREDLVALADFAICRVGEKVPTRIRESDVDACSVETHPLKLRGKRHLGL